ncbi:CRISPR-associated endonuclease Cas2 [Parafilimonas terrae]|uniref:CRISPR-associated endoribonuclease Cas2 n=1 Tax=Parafilimonas terrae TaxID=1465490 RepID=A0A1I5TIU9_9BACT|nr:CRISPR-associated endonuclease Cas2 [Parafilimonas terrae]SFP82979.1 CRISPR-associated protein, Cas2 family [Parafilimonas terrae]
MDILLIISYDMNNDKGRTKLAKELERFGFTRIQYSVFAGTATIAQWRNRKKKIEGIFLKYAEAGDKLYAIPQSEKMFKQAEMHGTGFDIDWVTGKVHTLYY